VVTPENVYDKNKAKELLTQCGNQVVSQCLQNLLDARLITRANAEQERLVPGRQFRSTDKYISHSIFAHSLDGILPFGVRWQIRFLTKLKLFEIF